MFEEQFQYTSIGVIRTPFESPEGMPIQPIGADAADGTVELDESYADGLQDLDGFSHCILLYHFYDTADSAPLEVEPFLDKEKRGVFATRAPQRPNQIGLSVVNALVKHVVDFQRAASRACLSASSPGFL